VIARPSSSLLRSLVALTLCFGGAGILSASLGSVVWGQERRLPDLLKERNKAIQTYTDTGAELADLDRRLVTEAKALDAANARVREAEADGGPFASSEIQRRRREARKIANRKASLMLMKGQVAPRHEFERVAMIEARSAYASRLLDRAYILGQQGERQRTRQIREYTELALGELSAIARHRRLGKRGSDLGRVVPPLDPDASAEEMEWRVNAYRRQVKTFTSQLKTLKPREVRLERHVKHLSKLLQRGYALPELTKTLQRERGELAQVQGLRRAIEKQTSYYQKLAVQLQERLDARRSGEKK
jgi:hypothetical protein